jgi:hypothetical protein
MPPGRIVQNLDLLSADRLPYVKNVPQDGRAIYVIPYYDIESSEWFIYAEVEKLKYIRLTGASPISGIYLSGAPQDPKMDIECPMGTFVTQQFSFPSVVGAFSQITSDLHNLACVLEKFHLISLRPIQQRRAAGFLLESEVEYLMLLVRSVYDLVQRFAKRASSLVRSLEDPTRPVFSGLPESFADVCLHGNQARSIAEIQAKWGLSSSLAAFYVGEATTFLRIRSVRDGIAHRGKDVSVIFDADDGMAVRVNLEPWSSFDLWQSQLLIPDSLGSLRAFLAHVILKVVDLPTRFVNAYCGCVVIPGTVSPGLRCFLRSPFGHHLVNLPKYLRQPWERSLAENQQVPSG